MLYKDGDSKHIIKRLQPSFIGVLRAEEQPNTEQLAFWSFSFLDTIRLHSCSHRILLSRVGLVLLLWSSPLPSIAILVWTGIHQVPVTNPTCSLIYPIFLILLVLLARWKTRTLVCTTRCCFCPHNAFQRNTLQAVRLVNSVICKTKEDSRSQNLPGIIFIHKRLLPVSSTPGSTCHSVVPQSAKWRGGRWGHILS